MKYNKIFIAGLLTCSCNLASAGSSKIEMGYTPFPSGYGYMQDIKALQKATDQGDRSIIREHAWKLWAGVMQPANTIDWPLWYTWPNTTAAFKPEHRPKALAPMPHPSGQSIKAKNQGNMVKVNTNGPSYPIPPQVIKDYPKAIKNKDGVTAPSLYDGKHFQFNGDIMIATESLSQEAMPNIRAKKLFLSSTLDKMHQDKVHQLELTSKFIVTKHMYWPVKAHGLTGIPVWKKNFPVTFAGYSGYEKWNTLVGIDPSGNNVGQSKPVKFLYGVKDHSGNKLLPTIVGEAKIHALDDFYYHKITKADWLAFDDADKAILNSASYWANNQAIGVGDYLVSIAMHVNTKELPSWTLQSVWWSDKPKEGKYAANRPVLPQAEGPWDHYLLTDDYAVPANAKGELNIAVNPYIEGVTHPIATSCRNCHVRAGWPTGKTAGTASYQNPDCPGLLSYLTPSSDCLKDLTLTDYLWIIPDRVIAQ